MVMMVFMKAAKMVWWDKARDMMVMVIMMFFKAAMMWWCK